MNNRPGRANLNRPTTDEGAGSAGQEPRVLTIGSFPAAAMEQHGCGQTGMIGPEEITPVNLAVLRPDVVLTPLFGAGFDCLDVALALCGAGYAGQLRAVVSFVPNPALVRREIAGVCPGLDFDLIVTGATGAANPVANQ